ncbi:hypothetical protein ACJWDR_37840 [Streptomyces tauricus]|uniref:hypothetical protein n=1 Tax=Streptomyces tauricus TaxID=68274 RepID=UPI00387F0A8F
MTPQEHEELAAAVAELGALPMPVGPTPQADAGDAKAPWGRSEDGRPFLPPNGHWTDIPELVDKTVSGMQSRLDKAQGGHWYDASLTETWRAPGTVCTRVDGAHRNVGQFTARPADLDFVLHAHDDLSWCLGMIAKLRARVAELESERHSTNEALDDAVQALRTPHELKLDATAAEVDAYLRTILAEDAYLKFQQTIGEHAIAQTVEDTDVVRAAADNEGLYTNDWREGWDDYRDRVDPDQNASYPVELVEFAPREDPHDGPLHHDYRVGRDLPEWGGV